MATRNSPLETALAPQNLKRWTVEAYHQLSELGLLDLDERTELISGQIIVMAAKGTPHVITLQLLAIQIDDFLRDKPFFARTQDPIQLDDLSEPEPDLAIVEGNILTYVNHHPKPQSVRLIVEVADTTLKQDCEIKDKLYAQAKIPEYWVIDLQHRRLHIFQKPGERGYSSHLILDENNSVAPSSFPDMVLSVASMLSPVRA
ncbi:MAG: Uma2 family endonuclease [Phormidesmis sp.]